MSRTKEAFWRSSKGTNMVWSGFNPWPDADGPDLIEAMCKGKVCEIGCGTGRVAEVFKPEIYIGVDISQNSLDRAKSAHPDYTFQLVDVDGPYPEADTYLFYTVMLHLVDAQIKHLFEILSGRIAIGESMSSLLGDRKLNFQRDPEFYTQVAEAQGWKLESYERKFSTRSPGFRDFMVLEKFNEKS